LFVEVLQGQGLVGCLKIVETKTHQQGGADNSAKAGEKAGDSHTDAEHQHGERRKAVFPDYQEDIDNKKREKTWNFTNRLDESDMVAVQSDNMDRKIVKKGSPELQSQSGADSQQQQVEIHRVFFNYGHDMCDCQALGSAA